MKFEETKNKLEEYRKKKLKEEAQSSRRQFIWDIVTLQPVRRNLLRNRKSNENEETHENKPSEDDDEEIKDRTWTRIDYAIFLVKFLVWACLQVWKKGGKCLTFFKISICADDFCANRVRICFLHRVVHIVYDIKSWEKVRNDISRVLR